MDRHSYIMRDQMRDQVRTIMAWTPNRADGRRPSGLRRLAVRCLDRMADGLVALLQPGRPGRATP
jgi:hypothetical protein